jgi:lycopene beta-cyclase
LIVREFDAVIAGGGLSGLSLAAHLATSDWRDRSVLVVDDAHARPSAVSWGYWSAEPGLLDEAISQTYEQVRIHADGSSRLLRLGRYRYHVVRRSDLHAVVDRLVGRCPTFEVRPGRVERIADNIDGASVTIDGDTIRGRWVFDSVTSPPATAPADARLAFTGWQVRCDRPIFDPVTPVLFDFRIPQAEGSRFVYVLPEGPYQALVELTEFVPRTAQAPTGADRRAALGRYLSDLVSGAGYEILRAETAVLELRARPARRRTGRILAIGAAGGMVKASTGYAFCRIQRDSAAIARSLVRHGDPFHLPTPRTRYRFLDAVLLDVLDRDPAHLELAFARLFSANPVERVMCFLDERSRTLDDLKLIASLPPMPYLRAVARRIVGQGREGETPPSSIGRDVDY